MKKLTELELQARTDEILRLKAARPELSQPGIAKLVGCCLETVRTTLRTAGYPPMHQRVGRADHDPGRTA